MTSQLERLLILGLDGATWSVLDPMIERGHMPNLASLLKRSAYGTLRSTIPPVTSAAWTTMMTGCDPQIHGVFDHRYYDAAAGQMKVNHSARVRVPTVWHLLSGAGKSIVSLNLPVTYPPLAVNGIVVSGMDSPHLEAALSGAPEFAVRLAAEVPGYHLRVLWKRPPKTLEEIQANARETALVFEARARGGLLADQMTPDWSALMVQFQNLDPFQHRAWRYLNVDATGIEAPAWNKAAAEVMSGLDRAVGMLCELADRRGAGVMIVSDHGFGPCLGRIDVNRILIDKKIARQPGLGGKLLRRARQGVERLRLWNAKRGAPAARGASFEASITARYPLDWKRTLAFAPHQDTAAMLYMNTTARHGKLHAAVHTSSQLEDAIAETSAVLAEARHPETGSPLFPRVVNTAREYGIDPSEEGYPDLIAMPDEMYWVKTKIGSTGDWVVLDPELPGTHRPEGVVLVSAPGVEPGRTLKAELKDATPTILALLGQPIPKHIQGKPIGAVAGATVADHGEDGRRDAAETFPRSPHRAKFEFTADEQAIIEQRLADLGYLE